MKKKLIVSLLVMISSYSFSQSKTNPGTYQLMTTNVKANEVFTTDILKIIEENRKQSTINVIKIGKYTWVKILSQKTIDNLNFEPLSDQIIEINAKDLEYYSL